MSLKLSIFGSEDKSYEDSRAQAMIEDSIIGMTWEQFCLCTWVGSTSKASLATITPTERYNVVRTMVSNTEETQEDCEKIANYEKEVKENQVKLMSKKNALERFLEDMSGMKEPEIKEIPKNIKSKIKTLEGKIRENEEILKKIGFSQTRKTKGEIKKRIKDIRLRPQIVNKISTMKKYLIYAKKSERQKIDNEQFKKDKDDYFDQIAKDLKENESFVEQEDEEELKQKIKENTIREIAKDNENPFWDKNPSFIEKKLRASSKAKVTAEMKETKQQCPRCSGDVCLDGYTVVKYQKSYDKMKLTTSQDDVEFLEAMSSLKYDYDPDVEEKYDQYTNSVLRIKECKRILSGNVLTAELNRKNKSIGSKIIAPDGYKEKYSVEYLEERIEHLAEQLGGIEDVEDGEEEELLKMLKDGKTDVDDDYEEVETEIRSLRTKLEKLKKCENAQAQLEQWNDIQERLSKVTANLGQCENAQSAINKNLETISILKVKQREAEILSMQNVITSVNSIANDFLQKFFEDPISVTITMIKKTRNNTKMSLEICAQYRGHKYDINDFSQGEIIKINLAFILALNHLNNSPFLLLDEIMVNVDSSVISEVYSILKDISGERPIFVIDHHAVQGIFDRVLEFE